ncbi:MAG: hypothetical protein E4H16_05275 [Candidatus Atribacteria bacterium]|nr:MAG: hypothetical protein E4H16_05275 [Candidatus Atribacteria bacterium]
MIRAPATSIEKLPNTFKNDIFLIAKIGLRISKLVLSKNIHVCNIVQRFTSHICMRKRLCISVIISIYFDVCTDMTEMKEKYYLSNNLSVKSLRGEQQFNKNASKSIYTVEAHENMLKNTLLKPLFFPTVLGFLFFSLPVIANPVSYKIAVTTDVHGMIFPQDFIGREPSDHSLAHIYNYVSEQREKNDTLLFCWITEIFFRDSPRLLLQRHRYTQYTMKLTGKEIDGFLEHAAGINYLVDVRKEPGDRVHIQSFTDGSPFLEENTYCIAVNSNRGNGGGGHLSSGDGIPHDELSSRLDWSTDRDLRFYLMEYLGKLDTLIRSLWITGTVYLSI